MQRNGLVHDKTIAGGGIHEGSGGVLLSDFPEHRHDLAFAASYWWPTRLAISGRPLAPRAR
jgi:hypothetical protein